MKKLYFLFLLFLVGSLSFGQVIITEIADPNNNAAARYVEIYNVGTTGFDLTGWELRRWTNANTAPQSSGIDLTSIGTLAPGAFAIIAANGTEFAAVYGMAADISAGTGGAADSNGDDKIAIFDDLDNTIDIFGTPGVSSNNANSADNFEDGRAERVATVTGPNSTWTASEWDTDNDQGFGAGAQDAPGGFDPGQWIGASNSCGVVFGSASFTCNSNTIGADNDGVIVNIPYTGSNAGITDVTTTSGGTVGGDDPATTADGVITITGLFEGAAWDITLVGGDCDSITTSGTVDSNECDPSPNTCFDLSTGLELFELVAVATNSDTDQWTESAGTYSMNGFCGSGCLEESNTWLIFGPLDMTSVTDLVLEFDAVEGFDGSDLNIQYTSLYTGCPDGSVWTSAQTVSASGNYSIDLSAATGTDVFIGVQYLDSDGSYSSYDLSNVRLAAFGPCPTLGTRPTSDCALCDVVLQSESYVCESNTTGAGTDTVTVTVPYSGVDNTIVSVTVTGGTQGGDDPALTPDGEITISGVIEGGGWSVTLNGGDCDGTTTSGTVGATLCDPTPLVINEILADPDSTTGDANNDGTANFSDDEFVEIYNNTASPIDMSGYTLSDGASVRHTFPPGTILQADAFIIVFGGGSPVINGLDQTASTGSLGLNNSGDTVTLTDDLSNVVTAVTYGSEAGNNQAIGRNPDFTGPFVQHTTITSNPVAYSPGAANDGLTLSTDSFEIDSVELYPNPTSTGKVTIKTTENGLITATVYNILGKQVKHETVSNNSINVSELNAGVYFVKITQNNATSTKKLIIN